MRTTLRFALQLVLVRFYGLTYTRYSIAHCLTRAVSLYSLATSIILHGQVPPVSGALTK